MIDDLQNDNLNELDDSNFNNYDDCLNNGLSKDDPCVIAIGGEKS